MREWIVGWEVVRLCTEWQNMDMVNLNLEFGERKLIVAIITIVVTYDTGSNFTIKWLRKSHHCLVWLRRIRVMYTILYAFVPCDDSLSSLHFYFSIIASLYLFPRWIYSLLLLIPSFFLTSHKCDRRCLSSR